jgi:HK97 family phage major capsid protein
MSTLPLVRDGQPLVRSWGEAARLISGELTEVESRAWNTYSGLASGGALLDRELATVVWDKARSNDGPLARCLVWPTSKHSFDLPAINESSRAAGSRWGGLRGFWRGQKDDASLTASEPSVANIPFEMQRLVIYSAPMSRDLLDDSILVEALLDYTASREIRYNLQDAMINGIGNGQPLGVINAPSSILVTRNTGTDIKTQDIDAMWARLWPDSMANAIWVCSADTLVKIDLGATAFNWPLAFYEPSGARGNTFPLIKGRPLIVVEQCPVLGAKGDLILGDWSQYGLCIRSVDNGKPTIELGVGVPDVAERTSSEHKRFSTDDVVFKWKTRADGKPMWTQAMTIANGSRTAGPFCVLV